MKYLFTKAGKKKAEDYISELKTQRNQILGAGNDTAYDTVLPTTDDILCDVNDLGVDADGEYYNGWGITDNFDAEPLFLKIGEDLQVA